MARTSPTPWVDVARGPSVWSPPSFASLLLAGIAGVLGATMGILILGHVADLGSQAPLVQEMLALGSGRPGPMSIQDVAADSSSQLLRFAALTLATGSAVALILGTGSAITARARRDPSQHGTGRRLIAIGLWTALVFALLAMMPLDGAPFALGFTRPDPVADSGAALPWHPAVLGMALLAVAGLLLSAVGSRSTAARLHGRV